MWTKPAKKDRLSHVSQAARFLDVECIDVECIEFLLHLVGDSAKESCEHTVLLGTRQSLMDMTAEERKRRLAPKDELCC